MQVFSALQSISHMPNRFTVTQTPFYRHTDPPFTVTQTGIFPNDSNGVAKPYTSISLIEEYAPGPLGAGRVRIPAGRH